jgi:hypothetical protein
MKWSAADSPRREVIERMVEIVRILRASVAEGIAGTNTTTACSATSAGASTN